MSRTPRLYVPDATYFVYQNGGTYRPIFERPEDYALFLELLATQAAQSSVTVHAFCCRPQSIHLAVRVARTPLATLMRSLTAQYARRIKQTTGVAGHLFRQRYDAAIIDAPNYLLRLVRFIHYVPGTSLAELRHACSSHASYLGTTNTSFLDHRTVERLLAEHGLTYQQLMQTPPSHSDDALFRHLGAGGPRVIGSPEFVASLPHAARTHRSSLTLEQIITGVSALLGIEPARLASRSRERELVLGRALIAWIALERGVSSLHATGTRLRRDASSLSLAISRYRTKRPDLFRSGVLQSFASLAPRSSTRQGHEE